ncbi:MAG: hypothetical protein ACOCXH_02280 [Cyclobacteriaceae bacterium]
MKKGLLLVCFFMIAALGVNGIDNVDNQKFVFYKQLDNVNEVDVIEQFVSRNYLGDQIAKKFYVLQELYTYEEPGTATSPGTKTIVEKPAIYYSLKKLNKHYKKMVIKEQITEEEAVEEFEHFLNIGISIVYQSTEEFEEFLNSHRKPEEIIVAFSSVVLKD